MFTPERFAEIDQLFEKLLEAGSASEKEALLSAHREDSTLVREVQRLLELDRLDETTVVSRQSPEATTRRFAASLADEPRADDRIGAYRLVEPIGRGGMGIVWRAERADGVFEQQVALKFLSAGSLSQSAVQRFQRERQILADLSHDSIARLLDGGVDDEGRPFLVMELVDGSSIVEHCDRERLPLDARLRLVIAAARAVQAAHRRLIVHCDLKPANILVTSEGIVKLLDFGIAELLGGDSIEETGGLVLRRLTPEYASPELLAGDTATTSSDVYQLGLLAYELACGQRARPRVEEPLEGWIRNALTDPIPPAHEALGRGHDADSIATRRRTTVAGLRRQLTGDLDAILRRATEADPADRYASVDALVRDLERLLDHRAVDARQGGWAYRGRKLVRRHPAIASLASLLLLLLVGLADQNRRARQARERAERQAAASAALAVEKQEVADFLVSLLTDTSFRLQGEKVSVLQLLRRGVERADQELPAESTARTEIDEILGRVYYQLGSFPQALELLDQSVAARRAYQEDPAKLATSILLLAWAHGALGHHQQAKALLHEARQHYETRTDPAGRQALAEVLTRLSYIHGMQGELEPMLELRQKSLTLRRQLYGDDHLEVAQALNDLCFAYRDLGQYTQARADCVEALKIRRAHQLWVEVARTELNLALVESALGHVTAAQRLSLIGLERTEELFPPDHFRRAKALISRSRVLVGLGAVDEAASQLRRAREVYAFHFPDDHRDLALVARLEAEIDLQRGRPGDALPRLEWALETLRRDHDENQHLILQTRTVLAEALLATGNPTEAREHLVDVERRLAVGRSDDEIWLRRVRGHLASPATTAPARSVVPRNG